MAMLRGYPIFATGWILWTLVFFIISGLAFMFRVAPLQRRLHALSESGPSAGQFDYEE